MSSDLLLVMDRSCKRTAACSSSWAQKKKHIRNTPVSEFKEVNFSQITESMKEWDILFWCCDTLLKDSPDGRYKILIVLVVWTYHVLFSS